MSSSSTRRCSRTTQAGRPCRGWAVQGTDPPLCGPHGGTTSPVGPPEGNKNAQSHGVYRRSRPGDSTPRPPDNVDIDVRIADLNQRIEQLSSYIDAAIVDPHQGTIGQGEGSLDVDQYTRLLSLHGQLTSRLGRLLRDKQQISPEETNLFQQAINLALDQASDILGVPL